MPTALLKGRVLLALLAALALALVVGAGAPAAASAVQLRSNTLEPAQAQEAAKTPAQEATEAAAKQAAEQEQAAVAEHAKQAEAAAAKDAAEQSEREAKNPEGERKAALQQQEQQAAEDAAEEKKVGLPEDLEEWMKPSYKMAVDMALSVSVPPGISPVDAAKYRISALRSRLATVKRQMRHVAEERARAAQKTDEAYVELERAGDELHSAYTAHEAAARGVDLDHVKGDPATLHATLAAAARLLEAQEKHFALTRDWTTTLPLGYDQELALDTTRARLEIAITTLEKQLADSITKYAERKFEKRQESSTAETAAAPSS